MVRLKLMISAFKEKNPNYNLHSTMVRLKLNNRIFSKTFFLHLHSTMVRLKQVPFGQISPIVIYKFTFHYG